MIMRKLSLLILLMIFSTTLWGKYVSEKQAGEMAIRFMRARTSLTLSVKSIESADNGQSGYYFVNLNPQGWVIVSADDVALSVIGYSHTGNIDMDLMPDNMRFMMGEYGRQVKKIAQLTTEPHPSWHGPVVTRITGLPVEPLIQIHWNQDAPYNAYCPKQEALVGCVAVSMSQAMSVQRYPDRPQGQVSYTCPGYGGLSINFNNEQAYNWNNILSGANNYDEAARLMYHAGMSVEMEYGTDGSGIPTSEVSRIADAFRNNFSYPDVEYYWREEYTGDWEQLLLNELNAGRAIVYNAVDSQNNAGHSFNLDGYDGEGRFHVNWGWGGYGDAYFTVDNLRDLAMNMDYDALHVAVIGIGAPNRILKNIDVSNLQIEEGLAAGAVVGEIKINGETPKSSFNLNVHGVYNSNNGEYAQVPFTIENNYLKTTETLTSDKSPYEIEITVTDEESGTSLTQGFRVEVISWKSLEEVTKLTYQRTTKKFMLYTKHNVSYKLIDEAGHIVESGMLEPLPELSIDVNMFTGSSFSIELTCGDEVKTVQIIK